MGLENVINSLKENKSFAVAAGAYIVCTVIDYVSTAYGLTTGEIDEINPLISYSMAYLGVHAGILAPKLALGALVIGAAKYIDDKPLLKPIFKGKLKAKAEHLLYPAAALTAGVGTSWLWVKYFF